MINGTSALADDEPELIEEEPASPLHVPNLNVEEPVPGLDDEADTDFT